MTSSEKMLTLAGMSDRSARDDRLRFAGKDGDNSGRLATTPTACDSCGAAARDGARFCAACGEPIAAPHPDAEYKQVTVLFADVVRSMDIAAALGAERLREIMAALLDRAAALVQRYDGTVDKFTGDGIMALFGAPAALEDHARRACLAAQSLQDATARLAADVKRRDGVELALRVGLNSGQVVVGELGSTPASYTAMGEQVGIAQRMESAAPPGGVLLSESTARLVEDATVLGKLEMVHIKGSDDPVPARRLVSMAAERRPMGRLESTLVGRQWEMNAIAGILERSVEGHGCVVGIVGPPGIGKSRLVRECAMSAVNRGIEVFWGFCESHTREIPFQVVAGLLRASLGVSDLSAPAAREHVRVRIPGAGSEDLLLLDDLLGIADPEASLPDIDPDTRRRRLIALINDASLARTAPAVYVIEDAHWIDEISDSMLAEFLQVIPRTRSTVLVTYRPEYRGALGRKSGAQKIALAPLGVPPSLALTTELLGQHPSVAALAAQVAERAAGNPFFTEEIVRDLAERGILDGDRGSYVCGGDIADASVPATIQATIAARIDRLATTAKHTLYAAAVIGARFSQEMLSTLTADPPLAELADAELIDQVTFTSCAEYAFRHPLIHAVAYDSQLKSERAVLHRRLAAAINARDREWADENAALIATHLEAAGDLRDAFGWHMRAGTWSTYRDIGAARVSWQRARQVADRLPGDDPDQMAMRIAPRTLLCGSAWHIGGSVDDAGFDEFRELTTRAGDRVSLAIGMAGLLASLTFHAKYRESSKLASDCVALIESIGNPTLTVALLYGPSYAKLQAGEVMEVLRLTQRVIDLADGDPTMGNLIVGSPLALAIAGRAAARSCLGMPGWTRDFDSAIAMARGFDATTYVIAVWYKYGYITNGMVLSDAAALRDTAEALKIAERSADDFTLSLARLTHGLVLIHRACPERELGFELLAKAREMALRERFTWTALPIIDTQTAKEKSRNGDLDGAIAMTRAIVDDQFNTGEMMWRGPSTTALVESLLRRGRSADLKRARAAIDRLAAVPTDPGFVLHELPRLRLRALLARAYGDEEAYRHFAQRYRARATSLGFKGHTALAEAMTRRRRSMASRA